MLPCALPIFSAVADFKDKYIRKFLNFGHKKTSVKRSLSVDFEKLNVKAWFPPLCFVKGVNFG
jgi:hypothetical protein